MEGNKLEDRLKGLRNHMIYPQGDFSRAYRITAFLRTNPDSHQIVRQAIWKNGQWTYTLANGSVYVVTEFGD